MTTLPPWCALRPFDFAQGMLCASHVFADSVSQMLTENCEYLCLGFIRIESNGVNRTESSRRDVRVGFSKMPAKTYYYFLPMVLPCQSRMTGLAINIVE